MGNDTSDKDLSVVSEVVMDGELGVKALSLARILPGETATWEVAYALPANKVILQPFLVNRYLTGFALPLPAAGSSPQSQPQLPAATPTVVPATLPFLEPGMTLSPGFTGVIDGDVPHTCEGKATGVVHPIEEKATSQEVIPPGDTARVKDYYRVTLCPGKPYQPSAAVFPKGDYEYRLFTAYETTYTDRAPLDPVDFFLNVVDAKGELVDQPVGRVLDPTVVAYADRALYSAGKTTVWTFAVAYPKTGGPYFLRTASILPSVWPLS